MTTVTTRVGNLIIPKNEELTITTRHNNEVNSVSIIALDGLNCGVPTITTPTMTPVTPTTFREFEQTISDSHQNEAGFVPPLVQPPISSMVNSSVNVTAPTTITDSVGGEYTVSVADMRSWQSGSTIMSNLPPLISLNSIQNISSASSLQIPTHVMSFGQGGDSCSSSSSSNSSFSSKSRKNTGGRRPNKENGISPEEEHKKVARRERNKIAAAKCRRKRMDLIQNLEQAVQKLLDEKDELSQMVQLLLQEKEDLEETLELHQPICRLNGRESPEDIKPFVNDNYDMKMTMSISEKNNQQSRIFTPINGDSSNARMELITTATVTTSSSSIDVKPRPNYLPVSSFCTTKTDKTNVIVSNSNALVTPSTEFVNALMGSENAGLSPMASVFGPSCSTQVRNTNTIDLASPESVPSKLVSL